MIVAIIVLGHFNEALKIARFTARNSFELRVASPALDMVGQDLEITPSMRERVTKKVGKVITKLGKDVNGCHIRFRVHRNNVIEMHSSPVKKDSFISEATLTMKGGETIRVSKRTDNMYASIDLVAHGLAQKLKKHNEKQIGPHHFSKESAVYKGSVPDEFEEFDEESLLVELDEKYKTIEKPIDLLAVEVSSIKLKSFAMPPITTEEALVRLYNIDHPFYMFRNKATNEINVLYRQESGGLGLIAPEK